MNQASSKTSSTEKGYSIRTLSIGLSVLETVLSSGDDWGITELAVALRLSKHQIFRHVHTLCDEGYLRQDPQTGRFSIGLRSYQMLQSIRTKEWLMQAARQEMIRLRDTSGHTVTLTKPIADYKALVLHVEQGVNPLQYALNVGALLDLHASAHGKVALAYSNELEFDNVVSQGLARRTHLTITDAAQLLSEIELVRNRRWAVAPGETALGMNALAVPILAGDVFRGSIGFFGETEKIPAEPIQEDLQALQQAADRIASWD